MAYFLSSLLGVVLSLVVLFVVVSSSFAGAISTTAADTNPQVKSICQMVRNPNFCFNVFNSDSRSANADLKGLCQIAIDSEKGKATAALGKIRSLNQQVKDPRLKASLNVCDSNYNKLISDLENATARLASGSYNDVNILATGTSSQANECENSFRKPPPYPSPLSAQNSEVVLLSDIIEQISNLLQRG